MSKMSFTRDAVKDSLPGTGNRPLGRPKFTNEEPVAGIRGAGTATDPYDTGNATGMYPISTQKTYSSTYIRALSPQTNPEIDSKAAIKNQPHV